MNLEHADQAVAAAQALGPHPTAHPQRHLDFPRSEGESPQRPLAPWPTPRLDPPKERTSDGAPGALGQEEDDDEEEGGEHPPGPGPPGKRGTKLSL